MDGGKCSDCYGSRVEKFSCVTVSKLPDYRVGRPLQAHLHLLLREAGRGAQVLRFRHHRHAGAGRARATRAAVVVVLILACLVPGQVILYRKKRGSPLDLDTHINQYVRSFLPPVVPHIKLEPGSFDDVDFNFQGL